MAHDDSGRSGRKIRRRTVVSNDPDALLSESLDTRWKFDYSAAPVSKSRYIPGGIGLSRGCAL